MISVAAALAAIEAAIVPLPVETVPLPLKVRPMTGSQFFELRDLCLQSLDLPFVQAVTGR